MPVPVAALSATLSMEDTGFGSVATAATLGVAVLAAAVIAASIAIVSFTQDQFPVIDQTAKMSRELDFATESLAAYALGAQLAGAADGAFEKSIQRLNQSIGEANQGLTTPIRGFRALGIELKEITELNTEEAFLRIADGISSLSSVTERAAAVSQIFGRGGKELTVLLSGGSAAIRAMKEEAAELGITFSAVDAFKVEEANDAVVRLSASFDGLFNMLAIESAPAVNAFAILLKDELVGLREDVLPGLIEGFKELSITTIDTLVPIGASIQTIGEISVQVIEKIIGVLGPMITALDLITGGMGVIVGNAGLIQNNLVKNTAEWQKQADILKGMITDLSKLEPPPPPPRFLGGLRFGGLIQDAPLPSALERLDEDQIKDAFRDLQNLRNLLPELDVNLDIPDIAKPQRKTFIDTAISAVDANSQQALEITTRFLQGGGVQEQVLDVNKDQLGVAKDTQLIIEDISAGINDLQGGLIGVDF